jgi:hypothetical protein
MGVKHRQHLVLEGAQLPLLAKKIGLVGREEVDGLVPFVYGPGSEAEIVMVLRECRQLQDHQPLSEASLEREARFGPELKARASGEKVA